MMAGEIRYNTAVNRIEYRDAANQWRRMPAATGVVTNSSGGPSPTWPVFPARMPFVYASGTGQSKGGLGINSGSIQPGTLAVIIPYQVELAGAGSAPIGSIRVDGEYLSWVATNANNAKAWVGTKGDPI